MADASNQPQPFDADAIWNAFNANFDRQQDDSDEESSEESSDHEGAASVIVPEWTDGEVRREAQNHNSSNHRTHTSNTDIEDSDDEFERLMMAGLATPEPNNSGGAVSSSTAAKAQTPTMNAAGIADDDSDQEFEDMMMAGLEYSGPEPNNKNEAESGGIIRKGESSAMDTSWDNNSDSNEESKNLIIAGLTAPDPDPERAGETTSGSTAAQGNDLAMRHSPEKQEEKDNQSHVCGPTRKRERFYGSGVTIGEAEQRPESFAVAPIVYEEIDPNMNGSHKCNKLLIFQTDPLTAAQQTAIGMASKTQFRRSAAEKLLHWREGNGRSNSFRESLKKQPHHIVLRMGEPIGPWEEASRWADFLKSHTFNRAFTYLFCKDSHFTLELKIPPCKAAARGRFQSYIDSIRHVMNVHKERISVDVPETTILNIKNAMEYYEKKNISAYLRTLEDDQERLFILADTTPQQLWAEAEHAEQQERENRKKYTQGGGVEQQNWRAVEKHHKMLYKEMLANTRRNQYMQLTNEEFNMDKNWENCQEFVRDLLHWHKRGTFPEKPLSQSPRPVRAPIQTINPMHAASFHHTLSNPFPSVIENIRPTPASGRSQEQGIRSIFGRPVASMQGPRPASMLVSRQVPTQPLTAESMQAPAPAPTSSAFSHVVLGAEPFWPSRYPAYPGIEAYKRYAEMQNEAEKQAGSGGDGEGEEGREEKRGRGG